ncbi:MAG: oligosaccharide flippase family protein [Gemmatimonadota bacterium]
MHTFVYGLGSIVQTGLGFILIPLYTRQFTAELYGVFTLITLAGTLAGAFFYLGASSAMARSYYDYERVRERQLVVSTALAISLSGALGQILLGAMFGGDISRALFHTAEYRPHIILALFSSAAAFLNNLFFVLLRFQRRSVSVVVLNLGTLVVTTALIFYLLLVANLGVMAPIAGTLAGQLLLLGSMLVLARKSLVPRVSRKELRLQIAFGIPNLVAGLAYYALDSIDRFFINEFGSLSDVGVYSLGYKIGMVIQIILVMPFCQIWAPMRMEYREESDAPELFGLVLTYFAMAGLLVTATVSVFSRELVQILTGHPEYVQAYLVVPIVMLAHLLYGSVNIVDNGIVFSRKVVYHVYIFSFALLVNVGLNLWLIPIYGYIAAAWTTLACYALIIGMVVPVSNRLYRVPWEWYRLALLVGTTVTVIVLAAAFDVAGPGGVLMKIALLAALVGSWYLLALHAWERRLVALVLSSRS